MFEAMQDKGTRQARDGQMNSAPAKEEVRFPDPDKDRWQPLRAGIQNLWEYDDQRFVFHRGRLLLRGRNESGKTKALELVLPFLLDADLSPQRLDPFGSMSRPMRWNLLNENNPEVKAAVGYTWLELGRRPDGVGGGGDAGGDVGGGKGGDADDGAGGGKGGDADDGAGGGKGGDADDGAGGDDDYGEAAAEFLTIGARLRAKRTTPGVEVQYFITSLRIDAQVSLLDKRRVPLSRSALESALGDAGTVYRRAADYRRAINTRLLGMDEDQYRALVEALLQLRRPQLSKQLQPQALSRILTASLPPLDPDVVGALAEGFDRLDRHRAQRATLATTLQAVRRFVDDYRRYGAALARRAATRVIRAETTFRNARKALKARREEQAETTEKRRQSAAEIERLALAEDALSERIVTLRTSDAYRAVAELENAEKTADRLAAAEAAARRRHGEEQAHLTQSEQAYARAEEKVAQWQSTHDDLHRSAARAARQAAFLKSHETVAAQLRAGEPESAQTAVSALLCERRRLIEALQALEEKVTAARRANQRENERLVEGKERLREAREFFAQAEAAHEQACARFASARDSWLGSLAGLAFSPAVIEEIRRCSLDTLPSFVRRLAREQSAALEQKKAAAEARSAAVKDEIDALEAEKDALAAADHKPPPSPHWRDRRPLERDGSPFYLLCAFGDCRAAVQADLEGALEACGLLDAWVTADGAVIRAALDGSRADLFLIGAPRPAPAETAGSDPKEAAAVDTAACEQPCAQATLADYLVSVENEAVDRETVDRILRAIPVFASIEEGSAADRLRGEKDKEGGNEDGADLASGQPARSAETLFWLSADGGFRLGAALGRHGKNEPIYIGAAARKKEKKRVLAALGETLAEQRARHRAVLAEGEKWGDKRRRIDEEMARFPILEPVYDTRVGLQAAHERMGGEKQRVALLEQAAKKARTALDRILEKRRVQASEGGLEAWVEALAELQRQTHAYEMEVVRLLHGAERLGEAIAGRVEVEKRLGAVKRRCAEAKQGVTQATQQAGRARSHLQALRESAGATRDEVLFLLRGAQEKREQTRAQLVALRRAKDRLEEKVGQCRMQVEVAESRVAEAAQTRTQAVAELEGFGAHRILDLVLQAKHRGPQAETDGEKRAAKAETDGEKEAATDGEKRAVKAETDGEKEAAMDGEKDGEAGDQGQGKPGAKWTLTGALALARKLVSVTEGVGFGPEAVEGAENKVVARQQALFTSLPPEIRLYPRREHGCLVYSASFNGRESDLLELQERLDDEVAARDRLLGEQERRLFESFLTGETHEHLRDRIRQAHALVDEMNRQLRGRTTASGMKLRLRWRLTPEAPSGTQQAIDLLLRSSHLLSQADRTALRRFLQQQLDAARAVDGGGTLLERMLQVLDYRFWFAFVVEFTDARSKWKPLTKKAHAAGSGGQKAVMLHLPLFAAAAAFYASGRTDSLRIVVLDEAFAGIDRETRGQLMGLLRDFDLDFMMTSYEEWGFYEALDGLSTYHLARERGMPGVYTDRFVWDGKQALELGDGGP
jgi:hypothetical protein